MMLPIPTYSFRSKRAFLVLAAMCLLSLGSYAAPALTLDSCLQLARENNAQIRKAQLDVERAKEVRRQAMTKYFPQVQVMAVGYHALHPVLEVGIDDIGNATVQDLLLTLYGNYGAALGLENTISLFQHGVVAGLSAIQPVYFGGKIVAGNQLAKLGVEASQLQRQITERDLLEEVEESYWLVVALEDKKRTVAKATQLLNTVHELVQSAVESGLALRQDLLQVEVRQMQLESQSVRLDAGLVLARRALCQSIGIPQNDSITTRSVTETTTTTRSVTETETGSVSETMKTSPEESLLALQTRAAALQRRMVIADALPHVAVGANYGYSRLDANILADGLGGANGAVFATVSVPLTAWWESAHKIKESNIRLEQAQLDERDLTEKLSLRTQQAQVEMIAAERVMQAAEKATQLAEERMQQVDLNYRSGLATITDILTAESELLSAENDLTDATIAYLVHRRRYQDLSW